MPSIKGVTRRIARAKYKNWDRCDLTYIELEKGTSVAGVLTQSKCPSSEVEWCRKALPGGKARALLHGRSHVTIEDIQALAHPTLRHRILVGYKAEAEGVTVDDVIDRLLKEM